MSVSHVPSATRTLRVLRFLADHQTPVSLECIARSCDLPRSTAYHLLGTMVDEGFVVHFAAEHRFGLGLGAQEVGLGFAGQDLLVRVARTPLAMLVDRLGVSAYLAVGQGREIVVLHEERGTQMPPLLTRPTRLPARLCASGRAILAATPLERLRALYAAPAAFDDGQPRGPRDLAALEAVLERVRRQGFAVQDNEMRPGLAGVAAPVSGLPHGLPAAVALTHRREPTNVLSGRLGQEVQRLARALSTAVATQEAAV
ncbi:IclR family transcriptional regulator [Nocardioides sp. AX2bis]|uniref:IclR family transcriptional regulator n=1 Tax=Nocardioides sp. AX2bis TaxID=2653157 RepID=UPI0012F254D4|nr:IclR family transcriptional regulator [Nocardioides sp. AX2bis]VXC27954.1 IclR family transcriptional regulator [Nocardioides sp. AX2bis]